MTTRILNHSDLETLLHFSREVFIQTFAHQNNPDDFEAYLKEAFTLEKLKKEMDTEGSFFYFTENETEILGFMKLNFRHSPLDEDVPHSFYNDFNFEKESLMEIQRFYVAFEHHGKGVAQEMMAAVESEAEKHNCPYMWLGVWQENEKAIKFYEKCGFEIIGEHYFMVGTDKQTDYLMVKNLIFQT